jgi:hypothetical protein|tara:strand:+ start:4581 stop:4757 length:177 start_codon:yes stop_codon:yes gene_type:complete
MNDFKKTQKELTELNHDGNEERGHNGEDESEATKLSEREKLIQEKLEELRKRDPFIYR